MAEAVKLRAEVVRIRGGRVDASVDVRRSTGIRGRCLLLDIRSGLKSVLAERSGPESYLTERGIGEDHWLDGGRLSFAVHGLWHT